MALGIYPLQKIPVTKFALGRPMRINFKRHDAYPGADVQIDMTFSARRPMVHTHFTILAIGEQASRDALQNDLITWSQTFRVRLKSKCGSIVDRYDARLLSWAQVAEFMGHWVGEKNLSQMLESASLITARDDYVNRWKHAAFEQMTSIPNRLEQRLKAAARAFLDDGGSEAEM